MVLKMVFGLVCALSMRKERGKRRVGSCEFQFSGLLTGSLLLCN